MAPDREELAGQGCSGAPSRACRIADLVFQCGSNAVQQPAPSAPDSVAADSIGPIAEQNLRAAGFSMDRHLLPSNVLVGQYWLY